MVKAYYTNLAIIDVGTHFNVQIDDNHHRIGPLAFPLLGMRVNVVQGLLYSAVKNILGHDQFFLIPSQFEVERIAYQEDMQMHPEKYPNSGESTGWPGFHD